MKYTVFSFCKSADRWEKEASFSDCNKAFQYMEQEYNAHQTDCGVNCDYPEWKVEDDK